MDGRTSGLGGSEPTRAELVAATMARMRAWEGDEREAFGQAALRRRLAARAKDGRQSSHRKREPWQPVVERTLAVMAAANGAASSHFREIHRDFGANYFACLVLLELAWRRDATPLADLVDQLSRPRTTVSSAVRRLLEGGYVEERPDPRDRRRRWIALTARGRRLAAQVDSVLHGIEDDLDDEDKLARGDARLYARALADQFDPLIDDWTLFREDAKFYDLVMPFQANAWWDLVPDSRRRRDRMERERRARERAPPRLPG